MKKRNNTKLPLLSFKLLFLGCALILFGCKKEDDSNKSYTVTVGVYLQNGSTYSDQNKDLVFETQEACQSWSRIAQGDTHATGVHDHYNAAKNTTYNAETETITWTEFGPELDQSSIDAVCDAGTDGATKTANKTDYSVDKNFFLKIKSVVEH